MFGNEIRYNELSDFSELKNFNVLNLLIKLAEPKRIDITKNYQFIDSSLIIPTTLGECSTAFKTFPKFSRCFFQLLRFLLAIHAFNKLNFFVI